MIATNHTTSTAPTRSSEPSQVAVQRLVEDLSRNLDWPVLVEDRDLGVLAYSRQWGDKVDAVRRETILRREAPHEAKEAVLAQGIDSAMDLVRLRAQLDIGLKERVCLPIRAWERHLGYLWLIDAEHAFGEREAAIAREAVADLASALHVGPEGPARDDSDLIDALVSADPGADRRAFAELERLGFPTGDEVFVCVAWSSGSRPVVLERVASRLSRRRAILGMESGHERLIISVDDPLFEGDDGASLRSWLESITAPGAVRIGISEPGRLVDRASLFRQAEIAFGSLQSGCRAWAEMGVDRLLAQVPDSIGEDIPASLRSLLEREPGLATTLEVFLDSAGDVKRTAARLSLHRSGLYYRLHRIEEMTGLDLGDGSDRLLAHIAVKTRQLPS